MEIEREYKVVVNEGENENEGCDVLKLKRLLYHNCRIRDGFTKALSSEKGCDHPCDWRLLGYPAGGLAQRNKRSPLTHVARTMFGIPNLP